MDYEYRFSATQNNGRITKRKDWLSGEEIEYRYNSLNRLVSAATTGSGGWGQSFGYDGFGNLLTQTVPKGNAPSLSISVDPATNRISGGGHSYDANGNLTATPMLSMTSLVVNEALLFHESLHALGLIDREIQEALKIKKDDNNTKNITDKLLKDCITGRGNR